jgi:urease accessory protein
LSGIDPGWHARLELGYARSGSRTIPVHRRHVGPLRIQKGLTPEGPEVWHQIVVHPPGGLAAGDRLEIDVDVGERSHVLLTTPGAAKWYRCDVAAAWQQVTVRVASDAIVEWLPLESIYFPGARAITNNRFDLAPGARLIAAELTCFGRPEGGHRFDRGTLTSRIDVRCDGHLAFAERICVEGGDPLLSSGPGQGGHPLTGTLIAAGDAVDDELVDAVRALSGRGEFGVTRLDRILLVRWRGTRVEDGWGVLRAAWALARPRLTGRKAHPPRVWAT